MGTEISRGLNPLLADSDGDGFIDGIEVAHKSNARDVCSQPLDAQNLDRLRGCEPKQIHAKPAQVQTPQKRTRAPAKTKPILKKKRSFEGRKAKNEALPQTAEKKETRNIEKANSEKKKSKPALSRNGSHPVRKAQTIRTRPGKRGHYHSQRSATRNHLLEKQSSPSENAECKSIHSEESIPWGKTNQDELCTNVNASSRRGFSRRKS